MTAKSRIVNNISYIDATVAGKHVIISEASIRSDLLFYDADGIDSLNNQAIFDNIQLMSNQLKDVPVPLDHFPVLTLTKKVLTFMVKKGKNFSGKVTPLFDSMLVQQTEDEGDASKRPSDSQPIPSPPHPSEDQPQIQPNPSPRPSPTTHIADSIPEGFGGDHGGQPSNDASLSGNEDGLTLQSVYDLCVSLCKQVTIKANEIKDLKAQVKKLKKGVKPLITHHKAWMKTRLARKTSLKKKGVYKEYVSKQGRKSVKTFKGEPFVHKDQAFDDLDDFVDVDDTLDYIETEDSEQGEAQGKRKGVEIRNVKETEIPRPTLIRSILTLRPLPKIDPKDKGKKRIEEEDESDTESEGITKAEKKFKHLANDNEVAKKVQEEWEDEEEKKRLDEEEATKVALSNEYDFIQARLNADKILAEKLQEEEREMYTIEQRAKFLHDTIAAQRKFLAQQRSEAIRNKPPSRNQLRNQMMTYLKHVGGKKHSDLKTKSFDEIQVLYEKIKRSDDSFIAIGSAEDEKVIKEMNEQAADASKKRVKKDDSVKGEIKAKKGTKKRKSGHVKMIARKRPRPQPDDDSDDEHRKCLRMVTFKGTIDSEIMETKSFIARLHKVSSPDGNYLVVYRVNGYFRAFNYLMEVLHIFDRQDLFHLYDLVMKQYSEITPEDIELILWEDLKIMMESSTEENDQELKDGTIIYMLVETRYPLSKELLQQMIDLGLEVKEESTDALQLLESLKLLQRQLFRSLEDWEVSSLQCMQRSKHVVSLLKDFQDSPDNEEDTRSSQKYLNDLEEEYQAIALLSKSKRFFSSAKATNQTKCHKCGKKGHFARDCWSKTLVPSYQSPFQQKLLSSSQHKPELRPTKDFEAKYNKVKAKLALLSSSASAFKASMVKNKSLITKAYEWDGEEVSSDDNEMVEVKVLMALAEDNDVVSKESARKGEWVNISIRKFWAKNLVCEKSSANDTKVSIPGVEKPWLSEAEGFILSIHDTGRILQAESQRNTTDPSVAVIDSLVTDYVSTDESLVCGTPLPPLEKLGGAEPVYGPKTIKSI
ncbi:retrovirus-related pol polyprotein from transposon TNT 1-94 [Tanacetum coccineum]